MIYDNLLNAYPQLLQEVEDVNLFYFEFTNQSTSLRKYSAIALVHAQIPDFFY
jgi:hypothetical protein